MTRRGDETRARLIEATKDVVRNVGYAHATTRAIADAAGVAEGTIYRHFPDKIALFFAAAVSGNQAIIEDLATLPDLAGKGTVEGNLSTALSRLVALRQDLLPLELALNSDPEMAKRRHQMDAPELVPGLLPPPMAISRYLEQESRLGRIRADIDTNEVSLLLLSALFGLMLPADAQADSAGDVHEKIKLLTGLVVHGLNP
jgi:AcrR family transcriptional regulator